MNRTNRSLKAGHFTLNIDDDPGEVGDLHCPDGKVVPSVGGNAEVRFGTMRWVLSQPARITVPGWGGRGEWMSFSLSKKGERRYRRRNR